MTGQALKQAQLSVVVRCVHNGAGKVPDDRMMVGAEALVQALEKTAPELSVAFSAVNRAAPPLLHAERSILSKNAVEKRQLEFRAGRHAARMALAKAGHPLQPIGKHENGAPNWPVGVSGSITHTDALAFAAVARSDAAFGIDLEENAPLPDGIHEVVGTGGEHSQAEVILPESIAPDRVIFSAKEATYKAISHRLGKLIEFLDVRISFATNGVIFSTYSTQRLSDAIPADQLLTEGNVFWTEKFILTYAVSCL